MLNRLAQALLHSTWAAWLLGGVLAVGGLVLAIDRQAQGHLDIDAERTAVAWARHIAANVPDIDLVFLGDPPSPPAQDRLTALRGTAGLFRFELYDRQGRLLLVSDSVATAPRDDEVDPAAAALARRSASEGSNEIELRHGDGHALPAVYSVAFVPVRHGDAIIGVVELQIDQTERAALIATSFRRAALTASALLALVFGLGAGLLRARAQRERRTEEQLRYLAQHDPLTGAVNRSSFGARLAQACAADAAPRLAVLCIDVDRFSEVNEAHGHEAGDALLAEVTARLQGMLRGADVLARLAGDRFVVLQHEVDDSLAVQALAQRIVGRLSQDYVLAETGAPVRCSASVGAALHGRDGVDADTLLKVAELALLQAKSQGRARWSFYDASLDHALNERRELAAELREALASDALELHFQPLFDAASGRHTGYEALARWRHPTRGWVPPLEFIAVAEETDQIHALGRWVLETACGEAARWPAPLTVAVNLSAAQFHGGGQAIVHEVVAALASSGLAPQRLELEITESLLLEHTEQVLATLHALRDLGPRIAMDDFGTGYSSLAYLWRFPFDKLKIDRAFTQGLGSDARVGHIVHSIVALAHALGIKVNAEGVETPAQRDALRLHGCDELQGFLLGRPQAAAQLAHRAGTQAADVAAPACATPACS